MSPQSPSISYSNVGVWGGILEALFFTLDWIIFFFLDYFSCVNQQKWAVMRDLNSILNPVTFQIKRDDGNVSDL